MAAVVAVAVIACKGEEKHVSKAPAAPPVVQDAATPKPPDEWADARFEMVERTVAARGITDKRVLAALRITPRHEFVPPENRYQAYDDSPLQIGFGLTISQPFIVATMTQAASVKPGDHVLEIGTGSGYQAAVLAMMGAKVWTMEIHPELAKRTQLVLQKLGFKDVQLKNADGYFGWQDGAPYDAILITCATPAIPPPLIAQLKTGGRIVAPVGDIEQFMYVYTKNSSGTLDRDGVRDESGEVMGVRFGPMKGEIDKQR